MAARSPGEATVAETELSPQQALFDLFDAAQSVPLASVVLLEHRCPQVTVALKSWATLRGVEVTECHDNDYDVAQALNVQVLTDRRTA